MGEGQAVEEGEVREERVLDSVTVEVEVMDWEPLVEALEDTEPELGTEAEEDLESVGSEVPERVEVWLTLLVRRPEALLEEVEVEEGVTPDTG